MFLISQVALLRFAYVSIAREYGGRAVWRGEAANAKMEQLKQGCARAQEPQDDVWTGCLVVVVRKDEAKQKSQDLCLLNICLL